jgi:hypothetical protein
VTEPVVYLLYIKPLGDNIYNQWELGGRVTFVWLEIETWVMGEGGSKREGRKGEVGGGRVGMEASEFCGPYVCLGVFLLLSGGYLCQGLQGARSV